MDLAVEGCTGWRYLAEGITAAGYGAHVAEPADTQAARGRKRHAKTDRADAKLLRELLAEGDLPESWIPPERILEWRERVRLYKILVDQRTQWIQRIHAELFQHGVSAPEGCAHFASIRSSLEDPSLELTPAARERISTGHLMIDATKSQAMPLEKQLSEFGTRQRACGAVVDAHYGIGGLTAVAIWSELGDCRRITRSHQVVRHSGLDIGVDSSDTHQASGALSCHGPPTLRWALYSGSQVFRPGHGVIQSRLLSPAATDVVEHLVNAERSQVGPPPSANPRPEESRGMTPVAKPLTAGDPPPASKPDEAPAELVS